MNLDHASDKARLRSRIKKLESDAAEHKRSTEVLASTIARTNSILEAAVDAILTIDDAGTIESVNPAAGRLFGYVPESLIGNNVKMLMPPPFSKEHDGYLERFRRTGERRIIGIGRSVEGLKSDGTVFPLDLSISEGHDGNRRFFTGILRDITDRREAEAELKESERRLRAILDSAVDGILAIDERGYIEAVNPAAIHLFGYPEEELLGENVRMLMPSPNRESHDGYLSNYRKTGVPKIIGQGREVIGRRKDGSEFPMALAVSEGRVHHKRIFTGIVRDLSWRERAQQDQANLASIVDESLHEIFVFDATTLHFLEVNRGARENLGYSLAELRERTPIDIKPEISREQFEKTLAPLRSAHKERVNFETFHERKDGSLYPVEVHLQRGAYGGKPAFISLILDLTDKKAALETLAESEKRTRAAEKLASIGILTAGIAHDVGTPMSVILGYAQMMEKSAENEKQRERARMIGKQTQRVTNLVQTLLDIARPREPRRVSVDLRERLDHALQFFGEKLRSRGIEVVREFADVPLVMGDPDRLEQVFLNLVVNGADAMPRGGRLTIRLEAPDPAHVSIRVHDTGMGIEPENLERIFEPFYTTKERGKGTGLGLLVSQGIIAEHEGELSVTSQVGVGTEFRIRLPLAPECVVDGEG